METALVVTANKNKVVTLGEGKALPPSFNEPERVAQEICTLHGELAACAKVGLEKALKIGGLLTEQKVKLGHGYFATWVSQCLPFTDRTARNYMRLYANKDQLKTETVSVLTDAYKLLSTKSFHSECNRPVDTFNAVIEQWLIVHGTDLEDTPGAVYHPRHDKAKALTQIFLAEIIQYHETIEGKVSDDVLIGEYSWADNVLLRLQNHIATENIRINAHLGSLIDGLCASSTRRWGAKVGAELAQLIQLVVQRPDEDEAINLFHQRIAELEAVTA